VVAAKGAGAKPNGDGGAANPYAANEDGSGGSVDTRA
jgi:hypothetical protein